MRRVQEKIRQGKGAGYEHFAKLFNLKEAAKTLMFLQEKGISTYEELAKKSAAAPAEPSAINKRIAELDSQQKDISELQKQIGVYGKTRAVYETYAYSCLQHSERPSTFNIRRAANEPVEISA